MKKYILFSLVFVYGFFNINIDFINAQSTFAPGCSAETTYSITTGKFCGNTPSTSWVDVPGCTSTTKYSTTTGQFCGNKQTTTPATSTATSTSTPSTSSDTKILALLDTLFKRDLTVGSKGDDVKMVQQVLKDLSFLSGKVDGVFGAMTRAALVGYQKDNKITPTGKGDAETFKKIKSMPMYNLCRSVNSVSSVRYTCPPLPTGSINILAPAKNSLVTSPLKISGYIMSGNGWDAFKGNAGSVKLIDDNKKEIATGVLLAKEVVRSSFDFSATLTFVKPETEKGTLVFTNANPSGLSADKKEYRLPVSFVGSSSRAPVLSGVSGPQTLAVKEEGSWTITVSDSATSNLSYKVDWGDDSAVETASLSGSKVITHTYSTSGVFTPLFTITNNGKNAQISLGVNVGGIFSSIVISGASAPQSLNISEKGTWIITASDSSVGNLTYKADWGDDTLSQTIVSSSFATFTHSFSKEGSYTPVFTVTNNAGRSTKISLALNVSGVMIVNVDPTISPYNVPSNIREGQSATFTFVASDLDNDDLSWSVDWGEGSSGVATCPINPPVGTGKNSSNIVSHTWENPGDYVVRVSVYDCKGGSESKTFVVNVAAIPTSTIISEVTGPQLLNANEEGTWTITASDSNGGSLSYVVNWGDAPTLLGGTSQTTTIPSSQTATIKHIYTIAGIYSPIFIVTNQNGESSETSLSVNVGSSAPIVSKPILGPVIITHNAQVGAVTPFSFAAANPTGKELAWRVDWGDGQGFTGAACPVDLAETSQGTSTHNDSHVWSTAGNYFVRAVVADCVDSVAEYSFTVTVQ